ncbi:MAG: PQQ-binding-like beta-propeller repeat protein [Candidatus Kaiserbacteria bacterium]|nr:PQQ-binding-like beta-propeller repeat protein [Candidatus Kaiserbacteria bacterium]
MDETQAREEIRNRMAALYFPKDRQSTYSPLGSVNSWTFDFRPLVLQGATLETICELFWQELRDEGNVQFGGLETASIPLVAGMILKAREKGLETNGFYIRKSRRKDGFQKGIEGGLSDKKIVLVDDALNSGKSFMRQIKALDAEGRQVHAICVLIRYRDESFYEYFTQRGIKIFSVFTLADFPELKNLTLDAAPSPGIAENRYEMLWKFESADPSYYFILPKSAPAIDDERLYFGADNGTLWALNQEDGSVAWNYRTLYGAGEKRIFSSPAVAFRTVFFGAYDGNVYALDAKTGKKKWTYMESDWIGSSPAVDTERKRIYIGLEFGLWKKQGGLAALDAETGALIWRREVETYVHSSPGYSKKYDIVLCGSSAGTVYAFDAATGAPRWQYETGGPVRAGFAFDEERGYVAFGSADAHIYVLKSDTGELIYRIKTLEPVYSTPLIEGGILYFGVLDKRIYAIDMKTGMVSWSFWTHSRVFATPVLIDGHIFCGSNDGRLYEIDAKNGAAVSYLQLTERIVNKIAYNKSTGRLFIPTYANEIYCASLRSLDHE